MRVATLGLSSMFFTLSLGRGCDGRTKAPMNLSPFSLSNKSAAGSTKEINTDNSVFRGLGPSGSFVLISCAIKLIVPGP